MTKEVLEALENKDSSFEIRDSRGRGDAEPQAGHCEPAADVTGVAIRNIRTASQDEEERIATGAGALAMTEDERSAATVIPRSEATWESASPDAEGRRIAASGSALLAMTEDTEDGQAAESPDPSSAHLAAAANPGQGLDAQPAIGAAAEIEGGLFPPPAAATLNPQNSNLKTRNSDAAQAAFDTVLGGLRLLAGSFPQYVRLEEKR